MKFGASSYIWVSPFGMDTLANLAHAKEIGFDIYEIAVEQPETIQIEKVRDEAERIGIDITICGAFGEERDLSSDTPAYRGNAEAYIRTLVDMAACVGSSYVAGPMYSAVGRARLAPPEERRRQFELAVEGMKRMAGYAAEKGVKLAMEPLNRFETDFMNTVEQGMELVERVGMDNVGFLLDTFHMNIEEVSLGAAIRLAGKRIFDFHACSNNRGTPGDDHLDWPEITRALADVGYDGAVVIESFTTKIREIARAVSLWRPLAESQDALASQGLAFLKKAFAR